jgi:hypothetical protein
MSGDPKRFLSDPDAGFENELLSSLTSVEPPTDAEDAAWRHLALKLSIPAGGLLVSSGSQRERPDE